MAKEKEKVKRNPMNTLLMFTIIIFFIAYVIVSFAGRGGNKKNKSEYEEPEIKTYDVDVKKIDVNDNTVQVAVGYFESFRFGEGVYKLDSLELEEIPKFNFIVAALANVDNNKVAYCIKDNSGLMQPITLDEINEAVKKLGDVNISMEDLYNNAQESSNPVGNLGYGYYSLLIEGNNIYLVAGCDASQGAFSTYTEQAETFGDYLNIYQRVAFGVKDGDNITYYNNYQREGAPIERLSEKEIPHFNKYKYALYKLTFLKVGDNYYFQGIVSRS